MNSNDAAERAEEKKEQAAGFDIREELKKLPDKPGVYLMHGPADEIIYIGKAVSLKSRVRQYFQSEKGKTAKIRKMISLIRRFEYIIVENELEALLLENNLIKENRPKYNTLLKDDKTYPYIKITEAEAFPRILSTRKVVRDRARYFGPYTSGTAVRDSIDLLHRLFGIRTCGRRLPEDCGKERPCLYYHIGQCSGPCTGRVTEKDYAEQVRKAADFLSGKYDAVEAHLKEKMQEASEAMEFEKAAGFRDLLVSIGKLRDSQHVTAYDTEDRDIIGIARGKKEAVCQVFYIREGRMIGRENFHIGIDEEEPLASILSSFLKQYYSGTPYIPGEIRVQEEPEEMELLTEWLRSASGHAVHIVVPKKGGKERLVELAVLNANTVLTKDSGRIKREEARTKGALSELAQLLDIPGLKRVESYDISNTNGFDSVGSMVVFTDGAPKRSDYRKFRIKTVQGPNDYDSMREVIRRRFEHGLRAEKEGVSDSFTAFPELILMDGGKGQITACTDILGELGLGIRVAGMVKDDRHRTRGLISDGREIAVDPHSECFRLITRIQDETHRFAIEYHKSLRAKGNVHSVLDDIPGVGTVRRRALMKAFRGIDEIRAASEEELKAVPGFDSRSARSVYEFFHKSAEKC